MLSYWEKKHFLKSDLLVVGAGFVGLSTAIHFKRSFPNKQVLVLERGAFPTGASTKNAGFACFGSLTEIIDDLTIMDSSEVLRLVERRFQGLNSIRKEFGDENLDFRDSGGFELLEATQMSAMGRLDEINSLLYPLFQNDVFSVQSGHQNFGFSDEVQAVIKNQFEGELDPGKYMSNLWQKATQEGVKILTGIQVREVDKDSSRVKCTDAMDRKIDFSGEQLAICTNAFTKTLLPQTEVTPGRGLILLSERLDFDLPWRGSFHVDKGYVYFREIDGRLLLGGGRNIDFEGENSESFEVNPKVKHFLDQLAREKILPNKKFSWEMEWTGIMGFGKSKSPIVQAISSQSAIAVRLGGMGVAVGWQVGKEMAELLAEM
ncbi:NAD(P)/FAD-dependent oxidoreductase [Algoriphagus namhaensis]|uniref:NAD(P)/FAD-dependent oxidoreductase n=1 Tax=Algoriphagus namhaensis TaxID=915353 RepID=A0ABV8ATX4_9BACT